jgi:hypothetical protein
MEKELFVIASFVIRQQAIHLLADEGRMCKPPDLFGGGEKGIDIEQAKIIIPPDDIAVLLLIGTDIETEPRLLSHCQRPACSILK